MRYLITGGCGFLGSNLAAKVLERGEELYILDNLSRKGAASNLAWLGEKANFSHGDVRSGNDVETLIAQIKPDVTFHIAGQVAMTTSVANPRYDFEVNALGTLNVLEALRKHSPDSVVFYASTNKVYGDLEWNDYIEKETRYVAKGYEEGFPSSIPLDFHSPYGCSKGAADQYILDYVRTFGLKGAVFRHSTMYGDRQYATFDQGWIGWFCDRALLTKKEPKTTFTIAGDGKQVRDILHSRDAVELYFKATEQIDKINGRAFNIGGGVKNSLSLRELFLWLEKRLNVKLQPQPKEWRMGDQRVFIANSDELNTLIDWSPQVSVDEGLELMVTWIENLSS